MDRFLTPDALLPWIWIAAINDLVPVTRNIWDFSDFQGLWIESWFEENATDSSVK